MGEPTRHQLDMIQHCERCGRRLNPDTIVWLELDCDDLNLSDPTVNPLPDEVSQGCFPFGPDCAKTILANGYTWGDGEMTWWEDQ